MSFKEPTLEESQELIAKECDAVKELLLSKNKAYGNSALCPKRIFSKASSVEQISVRIDDKLSRLMDGKKVGSKEINEEDVEQDLLGYLVLMRVARALQVKREQEEALNAAKLKRLKELSEKEKYKNTKTRMYKMLDLRDPDEFRADAIRRNSERIAEGQMLRNEINRQIGRTTEMIVDGLREVFFDKEIIYIFHSHAMAERWHKIIERYILILNRSGLKVGTDKVHIATIYHDVSNFDREYIFTDHYAENCLIEKADTEVL